MRLLRVVAALLVTLLAMPTAGLAQYQAHSFEHWESPLATAPADNLRLADSRPPNYGLVGGLIGAAVGIGLGVLVNSALKGAGDGGGGGPVIVVVGGLAGALIGYGFGRERERHPSEATTEATNAP